MTPGGAKGEQKPFPHPAYGVREDNRKTAKNAAAAAALCIFLQGEAGWEAALIPDDQPVFQNQFCHLVPGVR